MRRAAVVLMPLLLLWASAPASAAQTWHSQQPRGGGGYPLLGEVGDLECWNGEANRCLLITAGNGGTAGGLFAYDGSDWYRYSTVCGGHEGRIAWAGPSEFWTISDQQPGGQIPGQAAATYLNISLCHFKDGQVVASYGEPAGAASSYRHMTAAVCSTPSDCWFAGERLPEASASGNLGAFHLHWNGSSVAAVPSLTVSSNLADPGRAVTGLALHEGHFYESVDVEESDIPNNERESEEEEKGLGPSFVHRIEGPAEPFEPLFGESPFDYGGLFAEARELEGFHLTGGDGSLWAIAGSLEAGARVTALRLGAAGLTQLLLKDEEEALGPEVLVADAAAEPGPEDEAWISFRPRSDPAANLTVPARLVRIHGDGTVEPKIELPLQGEELGGEPVGRKGVAGPIACPAAEQCWLATRRGWLFHLGPDPVAQSDPAMHALVTSRPPDNSLPTVPPLELPEDTSGAGGSGLSGQEEEIPIEFEEPPRRRPALLSKVKQRLIRATVLELSFTLRAKAHVQLIARRKGSVVAKTGRYTLVRGRHSLRLRLDPKRWPTKLDLEAHAVKQGGSK